MPAFRARQIYDWIWKQGVLSFSLMKNLPLEARQRLEACFDFSALLEKGREQSNDGTIKILMEARDGVVVEGVLIPAPGRTTACISTQAGCPLACTFCATGQGGFHRDLLASEIVDEYRILNRLSMEQHGIPLGNIVYMGMGEPFLNYQETLASVRHIVREGNGHGMSASRITLSTVGIPEGIRALATEDVKVHLALSLHSALQEKRERLMPIARKYTLTEISKALSDYYRSTGRRITMEYLLLGNVNDGEQDLRALATFCKSFPVKVNLIEYNSFPGSSFRAPESGTALKWVEGLKRRNMVVHIRKSKGNDIAAACGQLAGKLTNES